MRRSKMLVAGLLLLLLSAVVRAGNPGPIRLACLGDSLTEGDGDDDGKGYPGRLQAMLPAGSQVKNFGKSGWTSEMMLQGYEGQPSQVQSARAWKPDVCFLWIGSNDLWYLYEYNNPDAQMERQDRERFRRNLEQSVVRLAPARIVLALLDDQSQRPVARRGEAFSGISQAELQRMSGQVRAYNDAVREIAGKHRLSLVDFSGGEVFHNPATLADDGNHPNSRGYDQIARVWLARLR